jgi:hypothetical protein
MHASLRVMARPSPVPPNFYAVLASAWLNSWNILRPLLGCHADPGIGDAKLDPVGAGADPSSTQRHRAFLRELAGVAQQVQQNLTQPHGIDGDGAEVLPGLDHQAVLVLFGKLTRSGKKRRNGEKGGDRT